MIILNLKMQMGHDGVTLNHTYLNDLSDMVDLFSLNRIKVYTVVNRHIRKLGRND